MFLISLILTLFSFHFSVCSEVQITINWKITGQCKTEPTLQVVVNPLLRRESSIHDNIFKSLAETNAEYVRFVPWYPYPRLAVAELQPPSGFYSPCTCGTVSDSGYLNIYCPNNSTISDITFASYGNPSGYCGSFQVGSCNANNSLEVVRKLCLGSTSCTVAASTDVFGEDPCIGVDKILSIEATCLESLNITYWNFTLIDPLLEDFLNATEGKQVIINFSTSPQWLWNTYSPVWYPDDPDEVCWTYPQGNELRDWSLKDIKNYYKRLVSWYTNGGFVDEYGNIHQSGHFYKIPIWEVLNEFEYEHYITVEYYTQIYDAIVSGILEVQPNMKFVGMALCCRKIFVDKCTYDLKASKELDWFRYFLNSSNHMPGIPLDFISYHFYATCENRTIIEEYSGFFDQADQFIQIVKEIENIRKEFSPSTKTDIDELGVILPDDNDPNPVPIPNEYWNSAGAMFAYIFGNLAQLGIDILGESQLVGYPTQFPSVSEIDWNTGLPNARLFVLRMLIENFDLGDQFVSANTSDSNVYALPYLSLKNGPQILLVNKMNEFYQVALEGVKGGIITYTDTTVGFNGTVTEEFSGSVISLGPWSVAVAKLVF